MNLHELRGLDELRKLLCKQYHVYELINFKDYFPKAPKTDNYFCVIAMCKIICVHL